METTMRSYQLIILAALFAGAAHTASAAPAAGYAGQESRDIKALSAEDTQAFLSGKGMGLAKAAELNGYPGPSHVLALAAELGLTARQRQLTQALFADMEEKAIAAGRALVDEERKLDQLFAGKTVTPELLARSLARIGELQAKVREVHLATHLEQVRILTPEQTAHYMQLRGYASAQAAPGAEHHHH
jgi:Spy/CpxP family protein refolding chaperone